MPCRRPRPPNSSEPLAYALKWNVLAILPLFAMLAAVGSLGLAAALTGPEVRIVGAAAITFFVMRIAFWVGYRIRPVFRAFGFSSCAYMNLDPLVAALWFSLA